MGSVVTKKNWYSQPLIVIAYEHLIRYMTPHNLSYFWGFGSLAGIMLVVQIVTGVLLAMHYTANMELAFASVENIMRNINGGWLFRYIHANGASMFFVILYVHLFRGLYYTSYIVPRIGVWISGVIIFLAVMATAFLGYVLPWGQMSFWGATVITNFFSAIPLVGQSIVLWLWGGFSVDNPTLTRFFVLHFLLPFIIAALTLVHLYFLHRAGSSNPIGLSKPMFSISFYPYFYLKDLFGFLLFLFVFSYFVFFIPNYLGHADNYIPANPMVTPPHIVPEWYFLPFYAILRSIPDKLLGVIAMFLSILLLAVLPFIITNKIRSAAFRPIFQYTFWIFVAIFSGLMWIGGCAVEVPYVFLGQVFTFSYFAYFLIFIPFVSVLEMKLLMK